MTKKSKKKNREPPPRDVKKVSAEVSVYHTRILKMSLSLDDNRSYWDNYRPGIERKKLPAVAFEERWFDNKTMARVRLILNNFRYRYDAYPMALEVVSKWRPIDPGIRQNICHWHLQLADPLYRKFTGEFLENRRNHPAPHIGRHTVSRWLSDMFGDKWAASTSNRIAENLITSAAEAGLCSSKPGIRNLTYPQVNRYGLAYLLYLLRHVSFEGSLLENPYLVSVGLSEGLLEQRLRHIPGLAFNHMGDLRDFEWHYNDLESWATNVLSLTMEAPV